MKSSNPLNYTPKGKNVYRYKMRYRSQADIAKNMRLNTQSLDNAKSKQMDGQNIAFLIHKQRVISHKKKQKEIISNRRLERLTLQDEAGQFNFGITTRESALIRDMPFDKRKSCALARTNLAKSMTRFGENSWNRYAEQSKKSLSNIV